MRHSCAIVAPSSVSALSGPELAACYMSMSYL
jgi:hypothetical protein